MKTLRKDCASGFSWSRMSEGKRKQLRSRAGEDVQSQTVKSLRDFAKILAFSPSGMESPWRFLCRGHDLV